MSVTGYKLGHTYDYHVMLQVATQHEFVLPTVVIQIFQCFAFAGAGITGLVAGHGWYKKNFSKTDKTDDAGKPEQNN